MRAASAPGRARKSVSPASSPRSCSTYPAGGGAEIAACAVSSNAPPRRRSAAQRKPAGRAETVDRHDISSSPAAVEQLLRILAMKDLQLERHQVVEHPGPRPAPLLLLGAALIAGYWKREDVLFYYSTYLGLLATPETPSFFF